MEYGRSNHGAGVCLFGLTQKLSVYLDVSQQRFQEVIPAAGSPNSSIKLSIEELTRFSDSKGWIDVSDILS